VGLLGKVDRVRLPRLYPEATLAVLRSRIYTVSIPALEAMSLALPVVATRVGGLPQVVRPNGAGFLVDPDRPASVAKGIATVLAMPDRGRSLGLCPRALVEPIPSWRRIAGTTAPVYEYCTASFRSHPSP